MTNVIEEAQCPRIPLFLLIYDQLTISHSSLTSNKMVNTRLPHEASDYTRMLICLNVMAIYFSYSNLMSLINFESKWRNIYIYIYIYI